MRLRLTCWSALCFKHLCISSWSTACKEILTFTQKWGPVFTTHSSHLFGVLLQVHVWEVRCVKCKNQELLKAGDNILQHFKQKMSFVRGRESTVMSLFFSLFLRQSWQGVLEKAAQPEHFSHSWEQETGGDGFRIVMELSFSSVLVLRWLPMWQQTVITFPLCFCIINCVYQFSLIELH